MKIDLVDEAMIGHHGKCMILHALTVEKNLKFRSNQMETDLSTARNVFRNINQIDINRNIFGRLSDFLFFI